MQNYTLRATKHKEETYSDGLYYWLVTIRNTQEPGHEDLVIQCIDEIGADNFIAGLNALINKETVETLDC